MDPIMLTGVETQTGAVFVGIYGFTATLFTVVVEVRFKIHFIASHPF